MNSSIIKLKDDIWINLQSIVSISLEDTMIRIPTKTYTQIKTFRCHVVRMIDGSQFVFLKNKIRHSGAAVNNIHITVLGEKEWCILYQHLPS